MKAVRNEEIGYFFALPRLLAWLGGKPARRAEFSAWEAYGFGAVVFLISCLLAGRALWEIVRPESLRILLLVLVPIKVWIGFLLLYYLNSLIARLLRRLRLYSAPTNNPLQHFLIMTLLTGLVVWMMATNRGWLRSLGIFWCALLALNLFALAALKTFGKE